MGGKYNEPKKMVVDTKAKKVIKKALKKVPGPIGSVARLIDTPRKLVNAVKNAKNLKPLKKGLGRYPTKKQKTSFKKAMNLKSPALRKVAEANKKAKNNKEFTGTINVAGKKLKNEAVMKRALRTTTREKKRIKRAEEILKGTKQVKRKGTYLDKKKLESGKEKFKAKQRQKNKLYHF